MTMIKKSDPTKEALLAYDYAAFCVLDWCDNASFHVPPALAARLDLLPKRAVVAVLCSIRR